MVRKGRYQRPGLLQSFPGIYRAARGMARVARGAGMTMRRPRVTVTSRPAKRMRTETPRRSRGTSPFRKGYVVRGNYRGKFKKPKKFKAGAFAKHGVIRTQEYGTVASASDVVYLGHGLAMYNVWQCTLSAIIRRLFEKAGISIKSMLDKVQGDSGGVYVNSPGDIQLSHQNFNGGALQVITVVIAADSTFEDVVQLLQAAIYTGITATDTTVAFSMIRWHPSKDATEGFSINSQIDLSMCKVHFGCQSFLTLQNRTKSSSAVGADETSALDIANNPVAGKVYGGGGNGATLRAFNNSVNVGVPLADPVTGLIELSLATMSAEQTLTYKRPPSANAFNFVKKVGSVRLGPGALKKDFIKYDQSMTLNTLVRRIKQQLDFPQATALLAPVRNSIGSFRFYAFEKMCNTTVDEPTIDIGVEINQTYRCRITEGKRGLMAFHDTP